MNRRASSPRMDWSAACLSLNMAAVFWFLMSRARWFSLVSMLLSSLPIGSTGSGCTARVSSVTDSAPTSNSKSRARVSWTVPETSTTLCRLMPTRRSATSPREIT